MDIKARLSTFNSHVDSYSQHREYIHRALKQAERFSSSIIEKVVLDHSVKASAVADDILPIVPDIEGRIAEIDAAKVEINGRKANSDEQMEELTLRQAIGELSDEDFEDESRDLRAGLDEANGELEELDAELDELQTALDRWVELADEADQPDGRADVAPAVEEPEADEPELNDEPVVLDTPEGNPGQHATVTSITEDLSDVFQSDEIIVADGDENEAIEAGDGDIDFAVEMDDGEGDDGGIDIDVEVDLSAHTDNEEESEAIEAVGDDGLDEDMGEDMGDEIGIDLDAALDSAADDVASEEEDDGDDSRRALLLYQEGTPDEQIYPFAADKLTIGRGRDNDIQIKNDSKVSRFHCRLFKRGGFFYIEDNKSSNGTLVNGELITERRLFGGEEIIIGETFFRFRIM